MTVPPLNALPTVQAPTPVRASGQSSARPEGRAADRNRALPGAAAPGAPGPEALGQHLDLLA